jgi:hypothetical protein
VKRKKENPKNPKFASQPGKNNYRHRLEDRGFESRRSVILRI